MQHAQEKKNVYKILMKKKQKESDHFEDLGADGIIQNRH